MARIARITVPGVPHHVTQRGNRRQPIFTESEDYALYRDLLAERRKANGVDCLAYCLMSQSRPPPHAGERAKGAGNREADREREGSRKDESRRESQSARADEHEGDRQKACRSLAPIKSAIRGKSKPRG